MVRGRRALRALAVLVVLLAGLMLVAAVLSQTAWFRERLRRLAMRQADQALEGTLAIGAVEGNLVSGVTLRDVTVMQGDVRVVRVGRVNLEYSIGDVLSARRTVKRITIDNPVVEAVRTPEGWNVARLLKPRPPADPNKPRATFTLPEIHVNGGQVTVREIGVPQTQAIPRRIEGLTFSGGIASSPRELSVDVRQLTFRAGQPDLDLRSLAGRIVSVPRGWRFQTLAVRTDESNVTADGTMSRESATLPWAFDLDVTAAPVSLPEIGRFVPAATFAMHPTLSVGVNGTLDALALDVDITKSEAGRVKGKLTLDTTAPRRAVAGSLSVADLDLAPILNARDASGRITGDTTFDLTFPSATQGSPVDGTATFVGTRASAYGYEATDVKAKVTLDGQRVLLDASARAYGSQATTRGSLVRPGAGQRELTLDLRGRLAGLDLRRLPAHLRVPALESSLSGTYAVQGALSTLEASATLDASTVEGATVTDGTTGTFTRTPQGYTFGAAGTVAGLDVQRLGRVLAVPAMTDERLAGAANGTFDVKGEQRGPAGLRVDATATLTDTTTYGGRLPEMGVTLTLDDSRLDLTAKGRIEEFELETLTATPAATGTLQGNIDARVTVPDVGAVSLDTIGLDGKVALERPTLFKVPFDSVVADLALSNGLATVRSLEGKGEGFTLTANGSIGLGPDDASDLRYKLVADSLVQPAKIADLPLTGSATTEGRVTGTRADFLVAGTVAGDQVGYGGNMAADVATAQYAVRLPDWDVTRLDVQTSVDAQQLTVSGVALSAVNGTVGYTDKQVTFDAKANDALRTLDAKGSLELGESMQRLTLEQANVSRNGVTWSLAPDSIARVAITPRQVTVGTVTLTNGGQRIQFEGTVGIADDAESSMRLDATDVDVSDVLVLAGQDIDVDGVLTASATLGGTRERPLADGHVSITQGRVRKIDIQSLGGRLTFDGTLALVDLELVKDSYARITAKGVLPRTILEGRANDHVAPSGVDRIDVAILSTPIDLALAEGASEYVTKLGGQAQMDVRITGSGRDPHVGGAVFLTNGTFVVPMTGVTYSKLDAVLTFEEERVVISELGVETDNGDRLSVEGELGLSREQGRTVSLRMKGNDFRVLDNDYGLLDLNTDMTISGTLIAPVFEGTLAVSDGRLELDTILPQVVDTSYATQAEYQGIPTERLRGAIVPDLLGKDDRPLSLAPGVNTFAISEPPVASTETPAATDAPSQGASDNAGEPVSVFDGTALNVQVAIPDNLVLRGQSIEAARMSIGDLNATVGGDFRIAKTANKPVVLLGNVKTVRGTYSYQGRRFDILRDGQILFRGGEEINPRLDVTAERVIQGVEARVRIQGTARRPELTLSSDPPLDDADILALIVFNQPLNQLGTGQQNSLSERAGGIAAGFVVSPLAQALGSTLDLDQFEVETTDPNGRVNPAVVIGQQVTQDMFLRFRQQFGNQQVSQFLLEYRLANFLRLQGNVAEGDGLSAGNRSLTQRIEQYGVDLVFYFSF